MHLEDFLSFIDIRQIHMYLTVKATGTQESLVEDIGTVGGSQDDDSAVGTKSVHLGEQLVEGVLALVIGTHLSTPATSPSHGTYLIEVNGKVEKVML